MLLLSTFTIAHARLMLSTADFLAMPPATVQFRFPRGIAAGSEQAAPNMGWCTLRADVLLPECGTRWAYDDRDKYAEDHLLALPSPASS